MKQLFKKISHFNGKHFCPVCSSKVRNFISIDPFYRNMLKKIETAPNGFETLNINEYYCPICNANDRDRLIISYLRSENIQGKTILEIAPSKAIRTYLKEENCTYRCCDLYMEDVDEICDITHMKCYEDLRFDYVICSHVLEHVHDDMKAVKEIFRILKVNGKALILVPIPIDQKEAVYDPSILDSNDRIRFFGQEDHVRMYSSKSLNNLLTGAGFWCNHWLSKDWNVNNMRIGLTETSKLYIGIKK